MASFPWPGQDRLATPTTALFRSACCAISVLPSPFSQLQTPAAQIAIGSKGTQDVLCGSNQQAAQVGIAGFGDTCTCSAGASVRS